MISIVIAIRSGSNADETIKSIRKNTREDFEIILVDDNRKFSGLAAKYNHGFSQAKGDVFVNMHNDVILPGGWDVPLASAARSGYIGCVFENGNIYIPSCCFSISRENWEKLGGYDEQFTGYHWEDTDLFLRSAQSGCGPVRCDVRVLHKRGASRDKNNNEYILRNKERYYQKHYELFKESGCFFLTLPDYANYKEVAA